jgi:hypothetical protein
MSAFSKTVSFDFAPAWREKPRRNRYWFAKISCGLPSRPNDVFDRDYRTPTAAAGHAGFPVLAWLKVVLNDALAQSRIDEIDIYDFWLFISQILV